MTARVQFDFTGAHTLVTGATSGIGHAVASLLRDAGAEVTVTGTRAAPGDYDVDLAGMTYRRLVLTEPDSIAALARSFDTLDVLINNAGGTFPGGVDESDPDGFAGSLQVNLAGPYRLTAALYPALKAAGDGAAVVNISSMTALRAVTLVPGYSAAKAGIINLTRSLAVKWAPDNIRVNAVAPGVIDTPMTAPMMGIPAILDAELAHIPLRRFGTAAEVASAVAFLCTAESSYINGAVILVDGASDCV